MRHVSPGHVSLPGSPGAGMVYVLQNSRPVSASSATTKPRMPSPPPDTPTMIIPSTASGAMVILWPAAGSATRRSQTVSPVTASSATTAASAVPMKTWSQYRATPRFILLRCLRASSGSSRTWRHRRSPFAASSASTWRLPSSWRTVTNMCPSLTMGGDWWSRFEPVEKVHTGSREATLAGVIRSSGL